MRWLPFLLAVCSRGRSAESGAHFLESVISQLKIDNTAPKVLDLAMERADEITGPTPLPFLDQELEHQQNHIKKRAVLRAVRVIEGAGRPNHLPPPPLSKVELAALYEAALQKGATLDLSAGGAIHGGLTPEQQQQLGLSGPEAQGYYYYFYPLKNVNQTPDKQQENNQMADNEMMTMMEEGGEKRVEPLFMAVSGFIGMALMFVVTVLFLPKFGTMRSRGITALKHAPQELGALTKLVVDAIDGQDCNERIACEVGRAVRTMHLHKKPLRIIERMLPSQMSKQVQKIRQVVARKENCEAIQCKLDKTKKVEKQSQQSQKKISKNT